jgi:hypothetical protein
MMEEFACAYSHCMVLHVFFYHARGALHSAPFFAVAHFPSAQGTRTCSLFFPLVLLFFVGALHVSLFISLLTSLYKHHEAAISLEHIYLETP